MFTFFEILFHLVVSVCSERQGTHYAQVRIFPVNCLHDVTYFEADVLLLATMVQSQLI